MISDKLPAKDLSFILSSGTSFVPRYYNKGILGNVLKLFLKFIGTIAIFAGGLIILALISIFVYKKIRRKKG